MLLAALLVALGCARERPALPAPLDDEHPFAAVDRRVLEVLHARPDVPGLALVVRDDAGTTLFERSYGAFDVDAPIAVASASKIVSGLVFLMLVSDEVLSLDDDVVDVLGWPEAKRGITLRHLLSFTSGLPPNPLCVHSMRKTLAACVDEIAALEPVAPPGTRYDYGSSHLHVAARMAEVKTGRTWAELFDARVKAPLGLDDSTAYFAGPKQQLGAQNPLIAGGLRITTSNYLAILTLIARRGVLDDGTRLVDDALFDAMAREPFGDVVIGRSPAAQIGHAEMRYGLACWLECDTPTEGCATTSSPGAFGFTPWIDRAHGYHAALAMELDRGSVKTGVVNFAVELEQDLQPLIEHALER